MNSSVLVSGFVVVGVGAMAILFNPFGSSEDTSTNRANTYQVSANAKKDSAPSPVSVTSAPEPFVWQNKKETVASAGILDRSNSKSATKKVAKPKKSQVAKATKSPSGLGSPASSASKSSTQKLQTVSKTSSNVADQAASTADADLDSFFGKSKPVTKGPARKPAAKVAKAPKTKPVVSKAKSEPVRVASKPALDSARTGASRPTQEVKTSYNQNDEMFSFSPRGEDGFGDAPKMGPVGSLDFDMPNLEPTKEVKTASKVKSSSQNISGSLDSVMDKPLDAGPVVKNFSIKNPLQTRLAVTFLANGKKVSLKPGQHFVVRQAENMQVKFSRGGSFGFSEQQLSEGSYQFSVTRKDGWKLAH